MGIEEIKNQYLEARARAYLMQRVASGELSDEDLRTAIEKGYDAFFPKLRTNPTAILSPMADLSRLVEDIIRMDDAGARLGKYLGLVLIGDKRTLSLQNALADAPPYIEQEPTPVFIEVNKEPVPKSIIQDA